jgi:protein arginine kinase
MWYKNTGPSGDIVLSTRIRLARNFQGIPFGEKMSAEDKQFIETQTKAALDLKFINLGVMSQIEKTALCEAHLISPEVASSSSHGSIFVNDDCSLCIMLGEEYHIRIQSFLSGFDLDKALEIANKVDDR